ncbi:MAG TPA: peptide chain release factor N(5)-glutamine methyltransferase [Aequorivita sp.]|nr:peptide chain release factor N(5)-glutamine methyltransferase [Aequorivita sp.]
MKIQTLKNNFKNTLLGLYPLEEIESFFNILSEKYLKLSRIKIALNPNREISEEEEAEFQAALIRLKKNEPLQYIIGETEFNGLPFKVNEHTLIPRPETEELVEWILADLSEIKPRNDFSITELKVLDIGTGSGCIAISLSKNLPEAKVSAIDISEEALKLASLNAEMNEVAVNFIQKDVLSEKTLPDKYSIIVSNPPYVRELEKDQMMPNVLNYEPEIALFVKDDDALLFYRTIAQLAKFHLKPSGKLYFEINEFLGEELSVFLTDEGFKNIQLKRDIYGKNRMLKCEF